MIKNIFALIGVVTTVFVGKEVYKEYKKRTNPASKSESEDDEVEGVDDLAEEDNFFNCDDSVTENE